MENTTCYQEDRVIFIFTVWTRMTSDLLIVVGHSTDYTPKVINTNSVPIRHLSLFPVKFIFFCEISNFPRIYSTIFFFEIIDIRTFKCCRTECQHENGQFSSCVERQCCHSLCGTRLSNSWNKVIIQFSSCVAQMYKCTYIYIRDKLSQCLYMYRTKRNSERDPSLWCLSWIIAHNHQNPFWPIAPMISMTIKTHIHTTL